MDKASFFAALPPARTEVVAIPGSDARVTVREMSIRDRIDFEAVAEGKSGLDVMTRLIAFTAVGDDGARLFSLADPAEVEALPATLAMALMEAANRLNLISGEAVQALGNA